MANPTKWSIDHTCTDITFSIKHLMLAEVKGAFKNFNAGVYLTGKDFTTAEIDLWIDASSINTGDVKRDEHIKGSDFFEINNHKAIVFSSSCIEKPGADGNYLYGKLTMKCITKTVKFNIQFSEIPVDHPENERLGFTITGKINRSDWELEGGDLMDEVSISCEGQLTNSSQKELLIELQTTLSKKHIA